MDDKDIKNQELLERALTRAIEFINREEIENLAILLRGEDTNFLGITLARSLIKNNGGKMLTIAALKGNVLAAHTLLNFGVNINDGDAFGNTALHIAVTCGQRAMTTFLIDRRIDASLLNNYNVIASRIVSGTPTEDQAACIAMAERAFRNRAEIIPSSTITTTQTTTQTTTVTSTRNNRGNQT